MAQQLFDFGDHSTFVPAPPVSQMFCLIQFNFTISTERIGTQFGTAINHAKTMYLTDFGDTLTFRLAPPSCWHLLLKA